MIKEISDEIGHPPAEKRNEDKDSCHSGNKEKIAEYVMKLKKPGDMILVLGAGNIKNVADELSARLNAN